MERVLDPRLLRPSGAILSSQLRLAAEIERRVVEPVGVPATVLDLLVRLDLCPDRAERPSRLCGQLNLSAAHMSRTIDRAEAEGLVRRGPDPHDRRAQVVSLTEAGDAVLGDAAPRLHRFLRSVVHDVLSEQEIEALVASLERIRRACDELAGADPEEDSHA